MGMCIGLLHLLLLNIIGLWVLVDEQDNRYEIVKFIRTFPFSLGVHYPWS
jgi:hypothetical protein